MVELMTEGPPVVGILGPTLSQELTVVGQIVPFYDVVQVLLSALFGAKARTNCRGANCAVLRRCSGWMCFIWCESNGAQRLKSLSHEAVRSIPERAVDGAPSRIPTLKFLTPSTPKSHPSDMILPTE